MYLGHFAVGLVAKPAAPKISMGILLVAAQALDILYGFFLLIGLNQPGGASPWDHGLVMTMIWSAMALVISSFYYRDLRTSILIGLLVLSHWVCDFISWDHILPLAFSDTPKLGLGLYNSIPIMFLLDFGLFGIALAFYFSRTKANDRIGKWAPWVLVTYLISLIPVISLPGRLIVIATLGLTLVMPIGRWIDRHRSVTLQQADQPDEIGSDG